MSGKAVVTRDGSDEAGWHSVDDGEETLTAALAGSGVLDGFTWRLHTSIRRHTVGVTIERDASVTVAVPAGSALGQVVAVLQAKRQWLVRRTAERAGQLGEHPTKEIVSGENFPYLGRNQRLLIVAEQAMPVRREGGRLCLRAMASREGGREVIGWYKRVAACWIDPRSRSWATRIGVSPTSLDVRDLGRRWGTTSADDGIALHWALFQLHPALVDYVLVHELVHLAESAHGSAFWHRLDRVLPDYQERRERLADLGRYVWLGDVHEGL